MQTLGICLIATAIALLGTAGVLLWPYIYVVM